MKCSCAAFPKTLHYESPAHGGWGLVRMAGLVPDVYMLFYTPAACGRHSSLGAYQNGIKDKVSYLFLTEEEIVSGSYEKQIVPAVDELLEVLDKRPRCFLFFGGCIDDFLGTDYEALGKELHRKYPDIKFRFCHMNPIQLDTKNPPGVTLFTNIYSMLEGRQKINQINFIGNNNVLDKDSEIYELLKLHEIEYRSLPDSKDFDTFLEMGASKLNLVLSPRCLQSAKKQQEELNIPYLPFLPCYDPDLLEAFYKKFNSILSEISGRKIIFDTTEMKRKAEKELRDTAAYLERQRIAIDFQATVRPVTLAKTLLKYGFNVSLLAIDTVSPFEKDNFEFLKQHYPDLEVASPLHHDAPKYEHKCFSDALCIGFDCGYMVGSSHIADLQEDNGFFG
ncbi:MAG: hypothetical protein K6G51_02550, partial [Sphaerochaetaceae bacterium]|nr:hypothetical protein [Sphaerochaetaceae bacterium]